MLCKAEVWVLRLVTCCCNCSSGAASISSIASTVDCTSMPLPEVLVAEFRMAFTAPWIASFSLELVELEEVDSPRSSLRGSLVVFPKLDRSELIELVPIPLLLCASGARGSPRWRPAGSLGLGRYSWSIHLKKANGGGPCGPLRQEIPSSDYWSSFRTACSCVLACARAAIPVCSRTWYLDKLATTCPTSASWIPLKEEDRFCEVLFMTLSAAFNWLMPAPTAPRSAATVEIAPSMATSADFASAAVLKSMGFPEPPARAAAPPAGLVQVPTADVVATAMELPVSGGPAAPAPAVRDCAVAEPPETAVICAEALAVVPVP